MQLIIIICSVYVTSIGLIYGNLDYDPSSNKYYKIDNYVSGKPHYGPNVEMFNINGIFYSIVVILCIWSKRNNNDDTHNNDTHNNDTHNDDTHNDDSDNIYIDDIDNHSSECT